MGSPNIETLIDKIDKEDLYLVERDLDFDRKVSLGFLLFADVKANAEFILQKLLAMSRSPHEPSDILLEYTRHNENWKEIVVEALAIIEEKRILRKLGLNFGAIRTHFLPHIPEMFLHINPVLKVLYVMCEKLTLNQTEELVSEIQIIKSVRNADHMQSFDDHLELHLLEWISRGILDASGSNTTNIKILIDYFKMNRMTTIKDMLLYPLTQIIGVVNDEGNNNEQCEEITRQIEDVSIQQSSKWHAVRKESAGYILIINQKNFHRSEDPKWEHMLAKHALEERTGTDVDAEALKNTFGSFGYTAVVKNNLKHYEMYNAVSQYVGLSTIKDSLIVCVLSHGVEGMVYGADSIPVQISAIEKLLTGPQLARKPKMLIIQACQGEHIQVHNSNTMNGGQLRYDGNGSSADYGDMIKALSTVPGFVSLRHTQDGSWFIQTLCKKIDELGDTLEVRSILTEVHQEVGDKKGDFNECMTPMYTSTLRKEFHLPKRNEHC